MVYIKFQQRNSNMHNKLTIIIPTCDRHQLIAQCIASAMNIFGKDACYIVGDSGKISAKPYILQFKDSIEYLPLQHLNSDMYRIYNTLLNAVKTEYVLVLEDDDILVNKEFHLTVLNMLDQHDIVSFAAKDIFNNTYLTNVDTSSISNMILSWNGEYQFGTTYFNTNLLKFAFEKWFSDYSHTFIYSSDEALAIIATDHARRKHIHFNDIGMMIGINNDNLSWSNLQFSMYATYSYINDIADIVNISKNTLDMYKQIQLAELQTLTSKHLTIENVFLSKYIMRLHRKVKAMIDHMPCSFIKKYIYNMMNAYINTL